MKKYLTSANIIAVIGIIVSIVVSIFNNEIKNTFVTVNWLKIGSILLFTVSAVTILYSIIMNKVKKNIMEWHNTAYHHVSDIQDKINRNLQDRVQKLEFAEGRLTGEVKALKDELILNKAALSFCLKTIYRIPTGENDFSNSRVKRFTDGFNQYMFDFSTQLWGNEKTPNQLSHMTEAFFKSIHFNEVNNN